MVMEQANCDGGAREATAGDVGAHGGRGGGGDAVGEGKAVGQRPAVRGIGEEVNGDGRGRQAPEARGSRGAWDACEPGAKRARTMGAEQTPMVRVGTWGNVLVRSDAVKYETEPISAAAPCVTAPTQKARRSQENADCIGGMRSPWKAVRRLPSLAAAGARVREALEAEVNADEGLIGIVDLLGKEVGEGSVERGWINGEARRLGGILLAALGDGGAEAKKKEKGNKVGGPWNADLVEAFIDRAGDPEKDLVRWLREGCPAGVAKTISGCGIFPATDGDAAADSKEKGRVSAEEPAGNYASVEKEAELSGAEIDRLVAKGYAVRYETWDDVRAAFGGALVSKLACVVKTREDGTLKVRNVLDLRRSGYNEWVVLPERVVLPRLRDAIDDARALKRAAADGEECFGMVADFEDAFHTLRVDPAEWRYLVARHPVRGFVGYRTVLCGGAGCPLLWGRAAAFLGRSGQAMFHEDELRTQTYVDDPATLVVGTRAAARRKAAMLLWWWVALGLPISWKKGVFDKVYKWIGAIIDLRELEAVTVTIPQAYAEVIAAMAADMLEQKSVPLEQVQRLAGKAGWAAGVAPVVWAQVAPLWAACADAVRAMEARAASGARERRRTGRARVGTSKMRTALVWLVALFRAKGDVLTKRVPVAAQLGPPRVRIYADASPWGCGAFLSFDGDAMEYLHDVWTEQDVRRFGVQIGDCRGQAIWEALALLIALRVWARFWQDRSSAMMVKSDSKAALGAFEKERSKSPHINAIAREISLDIALSAFEPLVVFAHVKGTCNEWADALSRLGQPDAGVVVPGPLRGCRRAEVPRRSTTWWRTS